MEAKKIPSLLVKICNSGPVNAQSAMRMCMPHGVLTSQEGGYRTPEGKRERGGEGDRIPFLQLHGSMCLGF